MGITFHESSGIFFLDGKGVTYSFFINEYGYAEHLYFGKTIAHDDLTFLRTDGGISFIPLVPGLFSPDHNTLGSRGLSSYQFFPSELTFFGTGDYREPTVQIQTPLGDRLSDLLYVGHEILETKPKPDGMPAMRGGETLVLHLKDKYNGFACDLHYTVYDDVGVVARRIVYKNESNADIKLNRAYSFALTLPDMEYDAITLHGAWARERQLERTPLHHGVFSIDSKRTSSSAVLNPFLGLVKKDATEEFGSVYGINLVYSSSFVLKAQGLTDGRTHITGGIQDFDFSWKLAAGECFETPEVVLAYSDEGIGGMSRCFHDAYRKYLINQKFVNMPRPLVINNWEGTSFYFDTDKLKKIADGVAGTGIDTFVLDDGWFGNRSTDRAGLGDWYVNEDKLPGGLTEIIEYVNRLGMKFGLWFEPEMVNEDSDLFRMHPDYAIGVPNRPRSYCRHQFMLDLTRKDVRDYIVDSVNSVLRNHNIAYVKWDYNRSVTESFSIGREPERQAEFAHRYALGVYDLFERIVEANPDVFFEGCSGGGARFDPGALYYFPQIWTSDCSDAEERTRIQYGTSIVYPLSSMTCHVTTSPNMQTNRPCSIQTRTDIAHLGPSGYELDSSDFTDEDRERIAKDVAIFRSNENLLLTGDLYRTENPVDGNFFGFMIVSKDKNEAMLTAYRRIRAANPEIKRMNVRGLDPDKTYYVEEMDRTLAGSTLMNAGLRADFPHGDFATIKYHFKAVPKA